MEKGLDSLSTPHSSPMCRLPDHTMLPAGTPCVLVADVDVDGVSLGVFLDDEGTVCCGTTIVAGRDDSATSFVHVLLVIDSRSNNTATVAAAAYA